MLSFSKGRYRGSFEFHNKLIETKLTPFIESREFLSQGEAVKGCFWWLMELCGTCDHLSVGARNCSLLGLAVGEGTRASS